MSKNTGTSAVLLKAIVHFQGTFCFFFWARIKGSPFVWQLSFVVGLLLVAGYVCVWENRLGER